jgi:activating signal cointegrator 1
MKAVSIQQPWATLVVHGAKRYETRTWRSPYAGLLAVHASRKLTPRGLELCHRPGIRQRLLDFGIKGPDDLSRGVVLGTVQLRRCLRSEEVDVDAIDEWEQELGDFALGRWVWLLSEATCWEQPMPCRGWPGLFTLPEEVLHVGA